MEPIVENLEALKNGAVDKFIDHVKSHDFVADAFRQGETINITFKESVMVEGVNITALFLRGGILRKTNAESEEDFLAVRKHAQ